MRDLSARFKAIQAAAGGDPSEQTALDLDTAGAPEVSSEPVETPPALPQQRAVPVSWARAEILAALERGAVSQALPLALQALADVTGDRAFAAEALPLVKPANTGEEWKRAFKTYSRYAPQVIDASSRGDTDTACDLFGGAAREAGEIFSGIIPGDPMAEELALAVYDALSRLYDAHRAGA